MGLKIDPSQLPQRLNDIENANQQAQAALKRVQQTQEEMLQINWQGGSATQYHALVQEQNDDVTTIINDLSNAISIAQSAAKDMQAGSEQL
jgi:WXG100 family type VII secretion target